jgi:hypothetical protein
MATQVFLQSTAATTHRGTNTAKQNAATSGWSPLTTGTVRGSGVTASGNTATVTGATPGVEIVSTASFPIEWLTPPVDANVTIAGTITGNIWAAESNMSANVGIAFRVDKVAAATGTLTTIATSAGATEIDVTTRAVRNFTATPTSTALTKGDRLRIVIFGDDAGTMAAGFTFNASYAGTTAAADGDTYISFTETFGFQTTDPTGTTLYLTDTASDVVTADVDREVWTSRGGGVVDDVRNTAAGWTTPLQTTDTAGGTAVTWFTKQLQAFTLSGLVKVNIRAKESVSNSRAGIGIELARVDSDGTGATVWAYADMVQTSAGLYELTASEADWPGYLAAADLAFTNGQRVRLRLFVDDAATHALATGQTVTTYYNGTSGGASGDTFVILPQTVAEFTGGGGVTMPPRPLVKSQAVNRAARY